MKRMSGALAAVLVLAAAPLGAIELSLEENRAERGNIGYIDMQKIFKAYPETIRAKENFEEIVQQTEEQVNLRKAEILRLRNEISELKIQRDFLAKTPLLVSPSTATAPAKTAAPAPVSVSTAAASISTGPAVASLPGFSAPPSTGAVAVAASSAPAPAPLTSLFPELSTAPIAMPSRPAAPILLPPTTAQAAAPVLVSTAAAPAAAAPNQALSELDAKIAAKTKELATKESDFKDYQASAEKNLLDLESRKTEILLGKIHKAIQEVAHREGVSVVVDKSSILFGHDAVDLTDKVLKRLAGAEEKTRSP